MSGTTEIGYILFDGKGRLLSPSQLYKAQYYNIEIVTSRGFKYRYKYDRPFPDYAVKAGQKRLIVTEEVDETVTMYENRLRRQRQRYRETPEARRAMQKRLLSERKKKEQEEKLKIQEKQDKILDQFPKTQRRYTEEYKLKDYYDAVMGAVKTDTFVFHKLIMEFKDPIAVMDQNDDNLDLMIEQIKRGFHILLKRLYSSGKGENKLQLKLLIRKFDTVGRIQGDVLNSEQDYQGFSLPRESSPINIYEATSRVDDLIDRFISNAFTFKGKHASLFAEGFISLGGIMVIDIAYEPESRQEFDGMRMNPYLPEKRKSAKTLAGEIWENSSRLNQREKELLRKLNS